jgi:hypothetical protein
MLMNIPFYLYPSKTSIFSLFLSFSITFIMTFVKKKFLILIRGLSQVIKKFLSRY